MMKKMIKKRYIQPMFAFIILPLINLYALFLGDPLRENISYITNALYHPIFGYIWSSSCALYLLVYTRNIMKKLHYQNKFTNLCLYLSCLGMFLSVIIPYEPEIKPFLADVHIQLSMCATLVYVLVFFHFLYVSYFREPTLILKLLPFYVCIVGSCCFLFILMGNVTTLLEIMFVIAMGIYLYYFEKKTATLT